MIANLIARLTGRPTYAQRRAAQVARYEAARARVDAL